MEDFIDCMQQMDMIDLPIVGRKYTWVRGNSCSRLDHMLVENDCILKFLELKIWALPRTMSDHYPLLLELKKIDWGPKPFRLMDVRFIYPDFSKTDQ